MTPSEADADAGFEGLGEESYAAQETADPSQLSELESSVGATTVPLASSWIVAALAWLVIPLACYAFMLTAGISTSVGDSIVKGLVYPAVAAVLVAGLLKQRSLVTASAALTVLLLWFGTPLAWHWYTAQGNTAVVGGLFPFSDSSGYAGDAYRLAQGNRFGAFSTRRPFFTCLLSSLVFLLKGNLQLVLASLVAITTYGLFFAATEVHTRLGSVATAAFLFVSFLFFKRFAPTLLTEHLGLAASGIALTLLLRGCERKRPLDLYGGLFFLSFALCARAGAMFVLPLVAVWVTVLLRGDKKFPLRGFAIACSLVALAFVINSGLGKIVGAVDAVAFDNFAHTAYGLVTRGTWVDAEKIYGGDTRAMMDAVFQELKTNPLSLWYGSVRAWKAFFANYYLYHFVDPNWRHCAFALTVLGYVVCLASWSSKPLAKLLVLICVGIFFSIPFVPPWDADRMRAYAVTIPVQALLVGIGLRTLVALLLELPGSLTSLLLGLNGGDLSDPLGAPPRGLNTAPVWPFAGGVLVLCFVVPLLFLIGPSQPAVDSRITSGSSIRLVPDSQDVASFPEVRLGTFRSSFEFFPQLYPREARALRAIPAGYTIYFMWTSNSYGVVRTGREQDFDPNAEGVKHFAIGHMRLKLEADAPAAFVAEVAAAAAAEKPE